MRWRVRWRVRGIPPLPRLVLTAKRRRGCLVFYSFGGRQIHRANQPMLGCVPSSHTRQPKNRIRFLFFRACAKIYTLFGPFLPRVPCEHSRRRLSRTGHHEFLRRYPQAQSLPRRRQRFFAGRFNGATGRSDTDRRHTEQAVHYWRGVGVPWITSVGPSLGRFN